MCVGQPILKQHDGIRSLTISTCTNLNAVNNKKHKHDFYDHFDVTEQTQFYVDFNFSNKTTSQLRTRTNTTFKVISPSATRNTKLKTRWVYIPTCEWYIRMASWRMGLARMVIAPGTVRNLLSKKIQLSKLLKCADLLFNYFLKISAFYKYAGRPSAGDPKRARRIAMSQKHNQYRPLEICSWCPLSLWKRTNSSAPVSNWRQ